VKFKIALVQFETRQYAPGDNLKKAEEFVEEAADSGADIIVFPEDFITGVGPKMTEFADHEGKCREAFRKLAKKHAVDLVPGSVIESEDDKLFNTTYYIDSDGEVLGRYRKVNLWLSEKPWATRGDTAIVCDTRWGKVGLCICWDLAFPELFIAMFAQRADIVICPSCWAYQDAGTGTQHNPNSERVFVDSLCAARAFENEIVVAFCNTAGSWDGSRGPCESIGRSQVAMPFIGPAAVLDHNREEMLLCDVDTAILAEAEKSYEIKKDLLGD